jgi:precorrin-2/cobalt-factor-2 C20-methyltransferase
MKEENKKKGRGKFFAVGLGPGDPDLLTVKAIDTIRACDTVAIPDAGKSSGTAEKIAEAYIKDKEILRICTPMIRPGDELDRARREASDIIEDHLDMGKNIAFLTLGDPAVYSTVMYFFSMIRDDGYAVEVVPGITSFSACAARLGISLCEEGEAFSVIPVNYRAPDDFEEEAGEKADERRNLVLMKAGGSLGDIKLQAHKEENDYFAVSNLGMESESLYMGVENFPDKAGYFTTVIVKRKK